MEMSDFVVSLCQKEHDPKVLKKELDKKHESNLKNYSADELLPIYSTLLYELRQSLSQISEKKDSNTYIVTNIATHLDTTRIINNIKYIVGWFDIFIKRNLVRTEVEKILQEKKLI